MGSNVEDYNRIDLTTIESLLPMHVTNRLERGPYSLSPIRAFVKSGCDET